MRRNGPGNARRKKGRVFVVVERQCFLMKILKVKNSPDEWLVSIGSPHARRSLVIEPGSSPSSPDVLVDTGKLNVTLHSCLSP